MTKRTLLFSTLLFLIAACGGNSSLTNNTNAGKQYHVAINGNDNADGSKEHPFKSIQHAVDLAIAGDTILIKAGIYKERIEFGKSGIAGKEISIKGDSQGKVIVDGTGISWGTGSWGGLIDITERAYITISNIHLMHSTAAGFFIDSSQHISLQHSSSYDTFSSGIGVWQSDSILIDNNEVELACHDGGEESISIAGTSNTTVSHNEVHHNGSGALGGEGIDIKDGSHDVTVFANHVHHLNNRPGIYADAWDKHTYNIKIYNNKVHDIDESGISTASEMGGTLENVSIYNNIVYNSKYGGIEVGGWSSAIPARPTPLTAIHIINNTLYKNGEGINVDNSFAKEIIIRNNIASENINLQIDRGSTPAKEVASDHNLIYGNNQFNGDAFVSTDPLFINAQKGNFNLKSNSPAIDSGSKTTAPTFDYNHKARPQNGAWDIGAFEL